MSQINLNKLFDIAPRPATEPPVPDLLISIPTGRVFAQLPDHPAPKLEGLSYRAQKLQVLESRLNDATIHQERDQIIACLTGAIMTGLVAGIVLGLIFCPPVAIASAITLFVLGFACSGILENLAQKDGRMGYEMIKYADIFCIGMPRIMEYLFSRKRDLQSKVNLLKPEVKPDLLEAGRYLREHIPAIQAKLEQTIQDLETPLGHRIQEGVQRNLSILERTALLVDSRSLLKELNEKGRPMVDHMIETGLLPAN